MIRRSGGLSSFRAAHVTMSYCTAAAATALLLRGDSSMPGCGMVNDTLAFVRQATLEAWRGGEGGDHARLMAMLTCTT